jgi:hypothetical protein
MEKYPEEAQLDAINEVWFEFYKDYQNQLGHWFRSLYNILKFVDQSKIENKNSIQILSVLSYQVLNCWRFTTTQTVIWGGKNYAHCLKNTSC